MHNTISLKKNADFGHVLKTGKSCGNRHLVVFVLKNDEGRNRLGVSVSKKMGKAVARNKLRRRIKEAYRSLEANIAKGHDIVILPRSDLPLASFLEVVSSLKHLMKRQGIF